MYHVSAQGVDERMIIKVHYCYYKSSHHHHIVTPPVAAEPEHLRPVVVPHGAEDAVWGDGRAPGGHQRGRVRALLSGVQRSILRSLLPRVGRAEAFLQGESA